MWTIQTGSIRHISKDQLCQCNSVKNDKTIPRITFIQAKFKPQMTEDWYIAVEQTNKHFLKSLFEYPFNMNTKKYETMSLLLTNVH